MAAPAAPAGGKAAEIYIGHAKDEVEEKKLGKKGRFVVDDPSKYPQRSEYTGGWTGRRAGAGGRGWVGRRVTVPVPGLCAVSSCMSSAMRTRTAPTSHCTATPR